MVCFDTEEVLSDAAVLLARPLSLSDLMILNIEKGGEETASWNQLPHRMLVSCERKRQKKEQQMKDCSLVLQM